MSHYPTCDTGKSYPLHPVDHCAECGVIARAVRYEQASYADAISEEHDGIVTLEFRGDSPFVLCSREVLVAAVAAINEARTAARASERLSCGDNSASDSTTFDYRQ